MRLFIAAIVAVLISACAADGVTDNWTSENGGRTWSQDTFESKGGGGGYWTVTPRAFASTGESAVAEWTADCAAHFNKLTARRESVIIRSGDLVEILQQARGTYVI